MNPAFLFAFRYLRGKKSHNIINLVAYISFAGIICGTAALIIVLSIFNGFENLTKSVYSVFDPEVKITPAKGKTFAVDSLMLAKIAALEGVTGVSLTLDENVLLKYGDRQMIAVMKGVDANYAKSTAIVNSMYDGEFELYKGEYAALTLGYDVAAKLGIFSLRTENPVSVYVPKREGKILLNSPASSLYELDALPVGIFDVEKSFNETYVFAPLDFMQQLLDRQGQASSIEVKTLPEAITAVASAVAALTGDNFQTLDRYQQNSALYRMMKSEKLIVYGILILIVAILSFNISGSLSMLVSEKKADIATLQSLGATDSLVKRIFLSAGLLITLGGVCIGLLTGLSLCLLQQIFGLLKLPGHNMLVDAYPVHISLGDITLVAVSVIIIGYLASLLSVAKLKFG
jgi:lipoprotein-releasing system permease protein